MGTRSTMGKRLRRKLAAVNREDAGQWGKRLRRRDYGETLETAVTTRDALADAKDLDVWHIDNRWTVRDLR